MKLIRAELKDYDMIVSFYKYVIDNSENMSEYVRWIYGKHPTDEMIRAYIETGAMFYAADDLGNIEGAVALTPNQSGDYHSIDWKMKLKDDEVSVVHILCVDPKKQKQGIAKNMMRRIIYLSQMEGKKAVRLDALWCNTPAQKLYEALGFERRGQQNWYAENLGWADFILYEYICPERT